MYNRDRQTDIHIPLHTKHVRTIFIVALNSHIFSYSRSVIVLLVPLKIKTVQYFLSLSQYSLYLLLNGTLPPPPLSVFPLPPLPCGSFVFCIYSKISILGLLYYAHLFSTLSES